MASLKYLLEALKKNCWTLLCFSLSDFLNRKTDLAAMKSEKSIIVIWMEVLLKVYKLEYNTEFVNFKFGELKGVLTKCECTTPISFGWVCES